MPTLTRGDTTIGWNQWGSGDISVLLIMGRAFGQRMWHRVIPALIDRYRVLTFDNRGVGESLAVHHPFTIEDMAVDALAVLDAAGVESAHVHGVSMGGLIAQEVAFSAPHRTRSLVLGCTGAFRADELGSVNPPRLTARLTGMVPRRLLEPIINRAMYGPNVDRSKVRADTAIIRSTPFSRRGLAFQGAAIGQYASWERLPTLTTPTLVLHGDHDRIVPIERGMQLVDRIPGARFQRLEGSGHNYVTDNTDLANRALREFLEWVDTPT